MDKVLIALVTTIVLFSCRQNIEKYTYDADEKKTIEISIETTMKDSTLFFKSRNDEEIEVDLKRIYPKENYYGNKNINIEKKYHEISKNANILDLEEIYLEEYRNIEETLGVENVKENYEETIENTENLIQEEPEIITESLVIDKNEQETEEKKEDNQKIEANIDTNEILSLEDIDETISTNDNKETTEDKSFVEYTYTNLNEEMYVTTSLNVRSGPSADYDVIGSLKYSDKAKIIGQCNETGWYKINFKNSDGYVSNKYLTDELTIISGVCQIDGNVDPYYQDLVNKQLAKLPNWVLDRFVDAGWNIYVTDKDIDDYFCDGIYGSCLGLTIYDSKVIYIEARENAINSATIHEIGHFIDCYNNFLSSTPAYLEIFSLEEASLRSAFNLNIYWDNKEFFAESLYFYYTQNTVLKNAAPTIYTYIESILFS